MSGGNRGNDLHFVVEMDIHVNGGVNKSYTRHMEKNIYMVVMVVVMVVVM